VPAPQGRPDLPARYEFVVQPLLAGHGPTLFAGLSKHVDLKLVNRLEFRSGAAAMRLIGGSSSVGPHFLGERPVKGPT
jgi:hypothetical protein